MFFQKFALRKKVSPFYRLTNQFGKIALSILVPGLLLLSSCKDDEPGFPSNPNEEDKYIGNVREMVLGPEASGFNSSSFTLALQAPDGSVITREGVHLRKDYSSYLSLSVGLADGIYRLLYFEYPITDNPQLSDLADTFPTTQFGLGSRIEVKNGKITVIDHFDEEMGLPGKGTAEEPYEISSYHSLIKLAQTVNSEDGNGLITPDTHFRQTGKIDMYQASREIDRRYGWQPIGANSALPFRGHYHGAALSTLLIERDNSAAVGLFGYVHNAAFDGIKLSNSEVIGNFAAGGIVGAALASGQDRGLVTITDCEVTGSEITGSDQSVSVGSLLGHVDMQSRAYFQNCKSSGNTISANYNAGGMAGGAGLYSSVAFSSCVNESPVTSLYSGAGGLIGSCDTVYASASVNTGRISGATRYNPSDSKNSGIGSGGLIGGTGTATVTSCYNKGEISGYAGVGGLVGSARVKGSNTEAYMYNNAMFRYSWNEGAVSGTECIGGLTGEAQTGTYAVYNKGKITGTRYVAGIAGCTSISVAHNAVNLGEISGADYVAGIVGKTQMGSLAINHNYGKVVGTGSYTGGIVALAGNNTIINYCGNYGYLSGGGITGGIVGEIGDPRKWTAMNIAECVIGSMEIVMGFVGPVMAVSEHAIHEVSKVLGIFLHVSEVLTDSGLLVSDTVLFSMGVQEMIEEKEIEALSSGLSQEVNSINQTVKSEMAFLREKATANIPGFDTNALISGHTLEINKLLDYYESEEGSEHFNEEMNLVREERAEYLEKVQKTNEIIHQVVSGVCIVVGAAATIGGLVATGGAAAPFVIAGSLASIAGGLNALTKTCMEFEENAVVISQCVNTGKISSTSDKAGGLVGSLQDNSIMRDCINTGEGPGKGSPFAGHSGDNVKLYRLLSLSDISGWKNPTSLDYMPQCAIWWPGVTSADMNIIYATSAVSVLKTNQEVADPSSYTKIDKNWKIGTEGNLWIMGSGASNTFPVPSRSEMQ